MRVLHLASWHPNKVHSQLGNFVRRHIEAIPPEVKGTVLHAWPAPVAVRASPGSGDGNVGSNGPDTRMVYVKDRAPRRWRTERAYMGLIDELRVEGYMPDLVHLHIAADAALPAMRAAELWQVPLVVSEHWTAYHDEHGRSFRAKEERAVRRVLQAASMHLPVSKHLGSAMAQYAPGTAQRVIPNTVDGRFVLPSKPRGADGPLRLLHVSSMVDAHKDISGMIRAFAEAVQSGADLVMDCIGGAGEGAGSIEDYRSLAGSLGLNKRIRFLGPAGASEVVQAMHAADVFVLFSRYENLPCVLLEAWMTGLPALATDVGGVGEHLGVRPELGTLLNAGDQKGLAQALVHWCGLKASGKMPSDQSIAGYAQERFTPAAVGRAYVEAYRAVLL